MRASWYGNKTKGLHTLPFLYPKGLKVCKPGLQEAEYLILYIREEDCIQRLFQLKEV